MPSKNKSHASTTRPNLQLPHQGSSTVAKAVTGTGTGRSRRRLSASAASPGPGVQPTASNVAAATEEAEARETAEKRKIKDLQQSKAYLIGTSDRWNDFFVEKTFHSSNKNKSNGRKLDEVDVDENDETELTTQHGEIMRSKLIDEFQLLSSVDEYGNTEAPRIQTSEISNPEMRRDLLGHSGRSLVKFVVYGDATHERPVLDKQFNRIAIRAAKYPSFALFCGWFVHSAVFQWTIMCFILINSICVGVQAEYGLYDLYMTANDDGFSNVIAIECLNLICLTFFIVEIILKMKYSPSLFWHNGWDIFDFFVTAISVIPEFYDLLGHDFIDRGKYVNKMNCKSTRSWKMSGVCFNKPPEEGFMEFLRVFRVFRVLKAIYRFRQIRLVVLALFKTLKTLVTILGLFAIFWFMFSVTGVIAFREGLKKHNKARELRPSKHQIDESLGSRELQYSRMFENWHTTLLTLFVIFTNDHWYEMVKDLMVVFPYFGPIFIISWVLVAAFIFQNIILGFLNNNFAEIRETIGKNISEMERLEHLMHAVNELKKLGKVDEKEDEERKEKEGRSVTKTVDTQGTDSDQRSRKSSPLSGKVKLQVPNKAAQRPQQQGDSEPENPAPRTIQVNAGRAAKSSGSNENRKGKNSNYSNYKDYYRVNSNGTNYGSNNSKEEQKTKGMNNNNNRNLNDDAQFGAGAEASAETRERDWERHVVTNLMEMEDKTKETIWPRDTLFDFFCLMETVQENLGERAYILQLIKTTMIDLADRKGDGEDSFVKAVENPDPGGADQFKFLVNRDHFNKHINHIVGHKEGRYIRQMIKAIMTEDHL